MIRPRARRLFGSWLVKDAELGSTPSDEELLPHNDSGKAGGLVAALTYPDRHRKCEKEYIRERKCEDR
jgi:hypothetical protein